MMTTFLFGSLLLLAPEFFSPYSYDQMLMIIGLVFLTTCFIPLLSMSTLRMTGNISSYMLSHRKERIIPFSFTALFYGITWYLFRERFGQIENITLLLGTITFLIITVTLVTLMYKISAHSVAMGGGVGFIFGLNIFYPNMNLLYLLTTALLISGLVMSARLYLNAHKPDEIYSGVLLGFAIALSSILFFIG